MHTPPFTTDIKKYSRLKIKTCNHGNTFSRKHYILTYTGGRGNTACPDGTKKASHLFLHPGRHSGVHVGIYSRAASVHRSRVFGSGAAELGEHAPAVNDGLVNADQKLAEDSAPRCLQGLQLVVFPSGLHRGEKARPHDENFEQLR